MSLADQPAFPRPCSDEPERIRDPEFHYTQSGMTYRQWLVGMALQGILSRGTFLGVDDEIGSAALKAADAAIRAQEKS